MMSVKSSLAALFQSQSIAVVGASANPEKVGHQVLKNLLLNPSLRIFPVNPKGETILGLQTYPKLAALPESAELVVIAVPAAAVPEVIDQCIAIKTQAVVLVSAGFAEMGEAGKTMQQQIVEKLTEANILLLGPNTLGFLAPHSQLAVTFGPHDVLPGNIALFSQSGAMLSALFQEYAAAKVGISLAVSLGNRAGITENELLEYAAANPQTSVIAFYLESFANIPEFMALASKICRTKPIFLLKGGSSAQGVTAATSHTAALATPQALLQDAAKQAGIVVVPDFASLTHVTIATSLGLTAANTVTIVTNAGGPAVILSDELANAQLPLAEISPTTKTALTQALPQLKIVNPLDLLGDAGPADLAAALIELLENPTSGTIICVLTEQAVTDLAGLTEVLTQFPEKQRLIVCLMGGDKLATYESSLKAAGVFVVSYPNDVVSTLSALKTASTNKTTTQSFSTKFTPQKNNPVPNTFAELQALLESYQLKFPRQVSVSQPSDMARLNTLTFPLVAKTTDLTLVHKAKLGGVITEIGTMHAAEQAYTKLSQWPAPVLFQETITHATEILAGFRLDKQFGWTLAVGLGGSLTNALGDHAYSLVPAHAEAFQATIARTKLANILTSAEQAELVETILTLQQCVLETPGLIELEINPFFFTKTGLIVGDIKRTLHP
jgi:acetyltransferase